MYKADEMERNIFGNLISPEIKFPKKIKNMKKYNSTYGTVYIIASCADAKS